MVAIVKMECYISLYLEIDCLFCRSVFFHFGMMFKDPYSAVLRTDEMGGVEIRIKVPDEVARDIVFHYQLRLAPKELRHETEYKGAKLDRFVFQSMLVDEVSITGFIALLK